MFSEDFSPEDTKPDVYAPYRAAEAAHAQQRERARANGPEALRYLDAWDIEQWRDNTPRPTAFVELEWPEERTAAD